MQRVLYQTLSWENTERLMRVIQYVTGSPCAGIIVSWAVLTKWSTTHSCVFPVLPTRWQCWLLWWPLCACQPLWSPGWHCLWEPTATLLRKWLNQQNGRDTRFFCLGFRNTFLLLQTQGVFLPFEDFTRFSLWLLHWWLLLFISKLFAKSDLFYCLLFGMKGSIPTFYLPVMIISICTARRLLYFLTPYSLIHKLILR